VRVLYFSDNNSDHNRRFLEALAYAGHELLFLNITGDCPPDSWLPRGVRWVQTVATVPSDANPDQVEDFLPELRSLLKKLSPDLLHAGPVQSCGYAAALSGFHPLLVMSWGSDMVAHAHRDAKWKLATLVALQGADAFFCDCDSVRRAAGNFVEIPASRIVQFPWGIQRGWFSPSGPLPPAEQLSFEPTAIPIISTRSWEPLYRVDVLLKALCTARAENSRLRLLLLGTGSEADGIRNFIVRHRLSEVVFTPGVIPRAELPGWFRAAKVYVSCAESDGTSISLLEAMATGLPVVVTNVPSNREWVVENENGWLADSVEQFAEKILRAASLTRAERERISLRNQQVVADRADWERNFPQLLRMYESLTSREAAVGG
jgi:glycosyltransferase involved in cell wall biosynthesis